MYQKINKQNGFTIVELLIVIVVIAILAAITIVSYNGITAQAIKVSMQSDLRNASTTLELDNLNGGGYPDDGASANGGQGLKASGDNTLVYATKPYGFCVTVSNPRSATPLRLRSSDREIADGTCDTVVSTVTGTGGGGYVDGPVATAQIYAPQGITVDANKNIYVADFTHRIRKISADGIVSTLAGSGTSGYAEGTGSAAQFASPMGLATDRDGNVYVADRSNHRIRKITPSGVVTTFAGTGSNGFADGDGAVARFYNPQGLAMGADGTLYVSDASNSRIRKISPSGEVSTLGVTAATPYGIAVDDAGTVYYTTMPANTRAYKMTSDGVSSILAGSGAAGYAEGMGAAAQFNYPYDAVIDKAGNMYIADYINQRIRRINPEGLVDTLAGSTGGFVDGSVATARFFYPKALAIDADGVIYVADMTNSRIRKIEQ